MRFLRYPLGAVLAAVGALAVGGYLALEIADPAGWTGASPNPAIRFFQSAFFVLEGKPAPMLALLGGGVSCLAVGAVLMRGGAGLVFAASLGCFAAVGAAFVAERRGGEPLLDFVQGAAAAVQRHGRDIGIMAGLGFSLLFIAAFLYLWAALRSRKGGPKRKAKAAAAADD